MSSSPASSSLLSSSQVSSSIASCAGPTLTVVTSVSFSNCVLTYTTCTVCLPPGTVITC
jgi:hypothetical protein